MTSEEMIMLTSNTFKPLYGKSIYWTTNKNDILPIKINPGTRNDIPMHCIHEFVEERVNLHPDHIAFVSKKGEKWNWKQLKSEID